MFDSSFSVELGEGAFDSGAKAVDILEGGSSFKRSAPGNSELFWVEAQTASMSPFFDGTLIVFEAGGADGTVKNNAT